MLPTFFNIIRSSYPSSLTYISSFILTPFAEGRLSSRTIIDELMKVRENEKSKI